MKILSRYITTIFLKNVLASILALTALFFFQSLIGKLLNQDYPAHQVIYYHLLDIPHTMVQMAPPGVMMGTMLTLSGLSRSHELVACYSLGIGLRHVLVIVFSLVFMICCVLLVMQDRALPPLFKKRTAYFHRVMEQDQDFFLDVKKNKIWYRSGQYIYNLKTFDPETQTIYGMAVYRFDDQFDLKRVIEAKRASYTQKEWILKEGTVTVFSQKDKFPVTDSFETKSLPIQETPEDFQEIEKKVDGLRLKKLYAYIQRIKKIGVDTSSYEVAFHSKISTSFLPLIMCLLAIPFSTRFQRQGGAAKDVGICLVITIVYWVFHSVSQTLGKNGVLEPIVAAWMPSLVFIALLLGVLTYRFR